MSALATKGLEVSFPASGDLSASQYLAVKLNSAGRIVLVTAITDIVIGILQNKPDAIDKPARILPIGCGGISKWVMGETLAVGVLAGTGIDGKAEADVITNYNMGIITYGGDADDMGAVLLTSMTKTA